VRRWLLFLFSVLAVVLTLSMQTTGALLTFALLILPALAALQLRLGVRATFTAASLLGVVGALAGLAIAVRADLHVESSIVVATFLIVPLCRLARTSRLLALLACASLVAAVPWLGPADGPPGAVHADADAHPAILVDVHLTARRDAAAPGRVRVEWTLALRGADARHLPPALWLIVTGDGGAPPGVLSEQLLVADTLTLERGSSRAGGAFTLEHAAGTRRLEGQLWSGPSGALDALPVDGAVVIGCELR
jgi:hypothetical protein